MMSNNSIRPLAGADALAANTQDFILLCGRILIGWIFIRSGYAKLFNFDANAASLVARGVPHFMAYIAVPVEFFGGLAVLFGVATRYAALLMAAFTVIATLISHRYWQFTDAAAYRAQATNFYKNVAIIGGFFFLFATGAGRISIDGLLRGKNSS